MQKTEKKNKHKTTIKKSKCLCSNKENKVTSTRKVHTEVLATTACETEKNEKTCRKVSEQGSSRSSSFLTKLGRVTTKLLSCKKQCV